MKWHHVTYISNHKVGGLIFMNITYLYGAGAWGKEAIKALAYFGTVPELILDENKNISGQNIEGVEICEPQNISRENMANVVLIIAICNKESAMKYTKDIKCKEKIWIIDYLYQLSIKSPQSRFITQKEDAMIKKDNICCFFDEHIARYDTNAGHKSAFAYLSVLSEKYDYVIYMVNDVAPLDFIYMEHFFEMGINVVIDLKSMNSNNDLNHDIIKALTGSEGLAFINRPDVANEYVEDIKKYTNLRIVMYGHDLHHKRLLREYEITHEKNVFEKAEEYKKIELEIPHNVDCVGYPSNTEVEYMKTVVKNANIRFFPLWFVEEKDITVCDSDFERKGIIFVGGFKHSPNRDGIIWFLENILPIIREKGIMDNVYVVGANPTEEILKKQAADVYVTGYVSEKELLDLYKRSRVAILPLRYGAGMKGKLLEALCQGIPVVSTSVGVEGAQDINELVYVADNENQFACAVDEICKLSKEEYSTLSHKLNNYIREYYSKEKFLEILEGIKSDK